MNIFILDQVPEIAATYHCDKHVPKMIVETAQLLSTAHRTLDEHENHDNKYLISNKNHPCNIWLRQSKQNYRWLHRLGEALLDEYYKRYQKTTPHKTHAIMNNLTQPPKNLPTKNLTPFAQAMPDQYKHKNAITAYRTYYQNDKAPICTWKTQPPPWWRKEQQ